MDKTIRGELQLFTEELDCDMRRWEREWRAIGTDFGYGIQTKETISKGGMWVDVCLQLFLRAEGTRGCMRIGLGLSRRIFRRTGSLHED